MRKIIIKNSERFYNCSLPASKINLKSKAELTQDQNLFLFEICVHTKTKIQSSQEHKQNEIDLPE